MSYIRTTDGICQRGIVRLIGIVAICVAVCFLAGVIVVWVGGLPGPHHGAYLAYASLHNIGAGLRDYNATNGQLPFATKMDSSKGVSWRIEVYQASVRGGFITSPKRNGNILIEYDRHKTWNDPYNLRLQEAGEWLFRYTQTDQDSCRRKGKAGEYATYYKAITGPGTAFDSAASPPSLEQLPKDLILVVRVEQSDTHWMEPRDLSIKQLGPTDETKWLLLGKDGYVVLFADGNGWVLSSKTPISDLCKFFTLAGAKQFDRDQILKPYRVMP